MPTDLFVCPECEGDRHDRCWKTARQYAANKAPVIRVCACDRCASAELQKMSVE